MEVRIPSKTITENFIWSIITTGMTGFTTIVYPVIIGFVFSESLLGMYGVATSWVFLLLLPISNGLAPALLKYVSSSEEKITEIISSSYFLIALYLLLLFSCLLILPIWLKNAYFVMVFAIFFIICSSSLHFQFKRILQGMEKFRLVAFLETCATAVFFFSILPSWHFVNDDNYSVLFLLLPLFFYHLSFVCLSWMLASSIRFQCKFNLIFSSAILRYSFFVGIGSFFARGVTYVQIILAGAFIPSFEVGLLVFWNAFGAVLGVFSISFSSILVPRICNIRKSDPKLSITFIEEVDISVAFIFLPIFGILSIGFAGFPEVLSIILLNKFDIQKYWIIAILAFAPYFIMAIMTPRISLFASSDSAVKFNGIISGIGSIITVLIWIFTIEQFGIYSIAIGHLGGYITIFVLASFATWKIFRIPTKKYLSFFFLETIGLIISLILLNLINPLIIIVLWIILHFFIGKKGLSLLFFSLTDPKVNI